MFLPSITSSSSRNFDDRHVLQTKPARPESSADQLKDGLTARGTSRFSITNRYMGFDQWGYGIWNGTIGDIGSIKRDERFRYAYLDGVRRYGYSYIKPPGVEYTMQAIQDRDALSEDEMDAGLIGNEDLVIEGTEQFTDVQDERQEESTEDTNTRLQDGPSDGPPAEIADNIERVQLIVDGGDLVDDDREDDLDSAIPEAVDEAYDDYDENEYEDEFIAEEEYDEADQSIEDSDMIETGEANRERNTGFVGTDRQRET